MLKFYQILGVNFLAILTFQVFMSLFKCFDGAKMELRIPMDPHLTSNCHQHSILSIRNLKSMSRYMLHLFVGDSERYSRF